MSRRDEVVTGVFVILAVALIVAGALWLSESRWRGDFETLTARFSTVGRLQTGNPVTLRGVEVGRVQSISVAGSGVDVVMRVQSDLPLPEEPFVLVHPTSLFGEWAAAIHPRSRRPGAVTDTLGRPPGTLPGATASDFSDLSEYAGDIAANLEAITNRLELAFNERTAQNLARSVENFEQASDELVNLLARQRQSFGSFADDMAESGETLRGVAADLDSTVGRLEAATAGGELRAILQNTREATASVNELTGKLNTTADEARTTIARADSALRRAETVLARVERGEGSLGRMSRDPALYENLSATLTELRALLDDLKQNPGKYFKFSVF